MALLNKMDVTELPYARHNITSDDIDAVVQVLNSNNLTQGNCVPRFEDGLVKYTGAKYAIAVNSATSALHLSCLSLGLSKQDWLWSSPISFVASTNCGLYCSSHIDFVDIEPETYNIDVDKLAGKLEVAEKRDILPKIVVVVHFAGLACSMEKISELAEHYKFFIVEDASHALGSTYNEYPIGCCRHSQITVFSFHPAKVITTGEGGVLMTNDKRLMETSRRLRTHGITREADQMTTWGSRPWYYEQIDLGYNYRMNDIEAALGTSQLPRLQELVKQRQAIAELYDRCLEKLPIVKPYKSAVSVSANHLYVVRVDTNKTSVSRDDVLAHLRSKHIGATVHYIPIHLQPVYRSLGFKWGDYPEAEKYFQEAISLPIFPEMNECDVTRVVSELCNVFSI